VKPIEATPLIYSKAFFAVASARGYLNDQRGKLMQNEKASEAERQTLVEEGTRLEGALVSSSAVVVKGKIVGDVTAPVLRVTDSGSVHGRMNVREIVSDGELSGELDADLVQLAGVVRDKTIVRTRSLNVKLAASSGRIEIVFGKSLPAADSTRLDGPEPSPAPHVPFLDDGPDASLADDRATSRRKAASQRRL
jgi:cytoskeletal protein CcmA (bactofilin family)